MKSIATILSILVLLAGLSACSQQHQKSSNISKAEMQAGRALLSDNCSGCHAEGADGTFSRISFIRKTPEGWDMNIARMMIFHGLEIDSKDRRALVKYLSDTRGLAPSETAKRRYVLDRSPNVIEPDVDPDLKAMCARCHSYARLALQRRDKKEWQNLVHMHLGQWASIEYQMLARERDWRADALGPVSEKLGKLYPLKTAAWEKWQNTKWKDLSGDWRIVGHWPGKGDIAGDMKVTAQGNGSYRADYTLTFPDGQKINANGKAVVYTGYEWRGAVTLGDQKFRAVWAAAKDGNSMTGRLFRKDHASDGMVITARRRTAGTSAIMNIVPSALKAGAPTRLTINGVNLSGDVAIAGAKVTVISSSPDQLLVQATADGSASGPVTVTIGKDTSTLAIYNTVDYLKVTPGYAVSRIGGGGGPIPKVTAQFEATGYGFGPDGKQGTADDVRLGPLPVVWSVDNYNAAAAKMQDAKYAGHITGEGTFIPAIAGPNPARKYKANNAGDLKVIATYQDGDRRLTAEAHLIATVQRWNNPPIM